MFLGVQTGYSVVACKQLHGHRVLSVQTEYSVVACKQLHGHRVLGVLTGYSLVVCKALYGYRVLGVLTGYSLVVCKIFTEMLCSWLSDGLFFVLLYILSWCSVDPRGWLCSCPTAHHDDHRDGEGGSRALLCWVLLSFTIK